MRITPRQLVDAAEIARRWIRYQAMLWSVPAISWGISHGGRVVMLDAMGSADLASGRPATPDTTSYRCASITKTMTATLVMQQVEARRMRLDDSIATYLGWTRPLPHAKDISIRHLLIHGGGVIRDGSNVWGDDDFPDRDTVRAEVRQRLTFAEPSTTFRYSNIAYVLLGEALESVTGRSFEALLQRDVLGPLDLKGSAPSLTPRVRRTLATGYYRRRPGENSRPARHAEARAFAPAGGLVSTVPDLLRYQRAHFQGVGSLISDLSRREMQRTQWQRQEEPNHGIGWMIWHVDGVGIRGHSGGFPGFTTKIGFAPELGLCAAVLNNINGPVPGLGVDMIFHSVVWVVRRWRDAGETTHNHSRATLGRFAGHYRGDIGELTIVRINRSLYLMDPEMTTPLSSAARLQPDGARRFTIVEGDDYGHFGEEVSFVVDAAGRSTAMRYGPHTLRRADI
ncbi:MAG: serine hydrolase domain-containing protein [Candidatus Dormiibacterota bacterium]